MHQFGWLSERGGNFFNLLQKEGVPRKGGGGFSQKRGGPTLEEMNEHLIWKIIVLVFCIKRQNTKSISLRVYEYTDIYIQVHIHHTCVHI